MKLLTRLAYGSFSLAAVVGSVAVSFFGWEPPSNILSLAAFTALLFAANARDTQAAAERV